MSTSTALAKRRSGDMALMPPPPIKKTKRPSTVLDEDNYTDALSEIIARDYFPGLAEAKAQEEYLTALESKNDVWIRDAGQQLKDTMSPRPHGRPRNISRDTRFDNHRSWTDRTPVQDTPRGQPGMGSETPMTIADSDTSEDNAKAKSVNTSDLSLTSFQAKYTSEDNESFNTLLDKQNNKRRQKYAHLWTKDQLIPSDRLLTHRAQESKLLEAQSAHQTLAAKHNEKALVPLTTGAVASRPASVQSWTQKTPNNNLMFIPDNLEDTHPTLQTTVQAKEAASKAGPKETVFANTRFPPTFVLDNDNDQHLPSIPPSPSLDTQIIETRDMRRAQKPYSTAPTETSFTSETPRVNGYAFVDEDEPENIPDPTRASEPSYRDLLAGQVGDSTPNPFQLSETRRREDLHLRLVAKDQARRKEKDMQTVKTPGGIGVEGGNMTPAARRLMKKMGRTPVHRGIKEGRVSSADMWTPGATPRRKK